MSIYHIIYKTTHINGKFYIGRHSTNNLNDGYFGSGKWVKSIKNKTNLSKEIIAEASSIEELYRLEEDYINKYYNDPLCMNYKRASNGWSSLDISNFNSEIQENGKNRSQNRAKNLYETKRSGLVTKNGLNIVYKKTEDGTNPFYRRKDGTSVASDKVKSGTHNLVGGVTCVDKNGNIYQIPKEEYYSQSGDKNFWKYVSIASNEGRKRTGKRDVILVSCIKKDGKIKRIPQNIYHSQSGLMEHWEWVSTVSKEGKRRKLLNVV